MSQPSSSQSNLTSGTTTSINVGKNERHFSLLAGAALLLVALIRPKKVGLILGPIGAKLVYRGLSGHSLIYKMLGTNHSVHDQHSAISVPHQQGIRVVETITVDRPVESIYEFWRDFSNLPRFMQHLEAVEVQDKIRSHWRVKGPAGMTIAWDAEIINDVSNEVIGWRSLENPYVDHAGSVRFKPAPSNQGTEITVEMEYAPLGGGFGAAVAGLFGESPQKQIWHDLHQLKQYLEAGEIAMIDGQPSGRAK